MKTGESLRSFDRRFSMTSSTELDRRVSDVGAVRVRQHHQDLRPLPGHLEARHRHLQQVLGLIKTSVQLFAFVEMFNLRLLF